MKKILLILVLVCGSLNSLQASVENIQERVIENLLSVRAINISEVSDICSQNICTQNICPNEYITDECLSYQVLNGENTELKSKGSSKKFETYSVMINHINGFTYHIADYYGAFGHSRVVTCLDGELRGLQCIADNGVFMVSSIDVKWHKNYFEHNYPAAKIYSYANKQVFELK